MINVLKASAGAGKTYSLVLEYIKALIKAEEGFLLHGRGWVSNPHRHILAITFTNNSTNEMKERILKDLDKLGRGEHEGYEEALMKDEGLRMRDEGCRKRIREAARRLLEDILNDYSMMRVSTIDSFFSQIIRSFSRDLGLDQTPVAEIDDAHIREKAVDTMLSELDGEKNKELLKFIKEFSQSQIADGKKWKIRDSLIEFSKIILSEDYITNFDGDKTTLEEIGRYKERLRRFVREQKAEADKAIDEMAEIAAANEDGMDSRVYQAIVGRKMNAALWSKGDGEAKFFKKGKGSEETKERLETLLRTVKGTIFSREYQTKALILKSIHITGVLGELRRVAEEICRDNDCILLSTANHLITKIIDGCEAPFIYERVGVSTNHYMIDEFQDTSHIQWENFMPLIDEANSQGNDSLIVGDIKQSIYRWRNGDWKILHSGIYEKFGKSVETKNLPYNFRSSPAVINFNNAIYKKLPELMDKALGKTIFGEIFSNAKQEIGEKNSGLKGSVETHFVGKDISKDEFMEQALRMTVNDIIRYAREERERLDNEEKNAKDEKEREEVREKKRNILSKTAVIVRKNDEAAKVAEALAEAGIPFCSSESFLLASDTMVKMIIAYMRLIVAPGEELYRREMEYCMESIVGPVGTGSHDPSLCSRVKVPVPADPLPMEEIPMAMVDAVGAEATPFVYSLVDTIKRYVMNNGGSIVSFLEWWDEHSDKLYIPMPSLDGVVTIMTIHKSKGLEFKNVYLLMTKETWKCGINGKHTNYRTVTTDDVPHIVIDINKLKDTEYDETYRAEELDCCIDSLNTLYVATTRAVERLFVVAHLSGGKTMNMNDLLKEAVGGEVESIGEAGEIGEVGEVGEVGEIGEIGEIGEVGEVGEIEKLENRAKRDSRMAFAKVSRESAEQRHGTVCHLFLSMIEKEGDEAKAIEKMISDGVISEEEKGEMMKVYSVLAEKGVFNPAYRSMNEKSIAMDGNIYRPDRIVFKGGNNVWVIDYKFGEERAEHKKQIEGYAVLLKKMGYEVETSVIYL